MNLTTTQVELLNTIQSQLLYGDIGKIAILANCTREFAGKVLDPTKDEFNEGIVDKAVEFLSARKNKQEGQIETLMGQ